MFNWLRRMLDQPEPTCDDSTDKHHFGEWETSESDRVTYNNLRRSYAYETKHLAIKYDRDGNRGVDKSNPTLVPYDDVATIWCKLSGCNYRVMVVKVKQIRRCLASNCREVDTRYVPQRYYAFHGNIIAADAQSWSELEQKLISHSKKAER